jgi:[ribosomal protein S5]-alanine N-acetyltransferase
MSDCRLDTKRFLLRPPDEADIPRLLPLIGDFEVARNLARIPHPYARSDAEEFVKMAARQRASGFGYHFAITLNGDGMFVGGIGLTRRDGAFELGCWLGKSFWTRGYATEAARALVDFAFDRLNAARLVAGWFHDNPASGRMLTKLGFLSSGAEQLDCLARRHAVYCHVVMLERSIWARA